jgi:hypothetical protein
MSVAMPKETFLQMIFVSDLAVVILILSREESDVARKRRALTEHVVSEDIKSSQ